MSSRQTSGRWRVDKAAAGERLDRFLFEIMAQALMDPAAGEGPSRRQIRRWIDAGRVQVGGRLCRVASRALKGGQQVELLDEPAASVDQVSAQPPTRPTPTSGGLRLDPSSIVFEDAHLLVVDKPTGVASQGTGPNHRHHLLAAAELWLQARRGPSAPGPWLHHRLDRGTSGLVLLAKSRAANRGLGRAFAERRIDKRYSALVLGHPPASPWQVDIPLRRVRGDGGRAMSEAVVEGEGYGPPDKAAQTEVTDVELLDGCALLQLRPHTGRMHQIRVHLAAVGYPVLGDRLYGEPDAWSLPRGEVPRPMLHAMGLDLQHPVSGRRLRFEVPPPADMQGWIDRLRSAQPPKSP